ncbi:hypothetical protein OsI_35442 [Oryza sativa Indica Group]|uniref:Uncharacterized protein n=1 Tax=Oryza sativa subsp. indica TaxID=39946 RepID=A2ZCD7_ORYSI|nr:hypothetical protein OsI_35442 [Oryza sativa Indica Group]
MEEFTFFPAATSPRRDHRLGLVGSPPPLLFAAIVEVDDGDDGEEEEKMDLLWEDFNEELARAPPVCPLSPLNIKGGGLTATTAMAKDDGGGGEKQARRMYSGSVYYMFDVSVTGQSNPRSCIWFVVTNLVDADALPSKPTEMRELLNVKEQAKFSGEFTRNLYVRQCQMIPSLQLHKCCN